MLSCHGSETVGRERRYKRSAMNFRVLDEHARARARPFFCQLFKIKSRTIWRGYAFTITAVRIAYVNGIRRIRAFRTEPIWLSYFSLSLFPSSAVFPLQLIYAAASRWLEISQPWNYRSRVSFLSLFRSFSLFFRFPLPPKMREYSYLTRRG